tara:strand:- start:417 stop:704 length:288 start_codon:yes stop_codon:yes gene_type:complete
MLFLSIFSVLATLYFANISRAIEKENLLLAENIKTIKDQININEIEYSLFNNYDYLKKLQKIYFETSDNVNIYKIVSYRDFTNKNLESIYTVGTK